MATWFRNEGTSASGTMDAVGTQEDGDSTNPIAGTDIARIVAEVDGGTAESDAASNHHVEPVSTATTESTELDRALAERRALVELCLYALDRARSGGVAERIEQGLERVGVTAVRPEGQRFDPAVHEAGGAIVTEDASLEGTVAETEVVGFRDAGGLLRAPVVTVYTRGAAR